MKAPERSQLQHLGTSIITIGAGPDCLGDLMHFDGHGTFDPHYGRVDVTKAEADVHNRALDEARLKGLDENCQVGQGGTFYEDGKGNVTTFIGTKVATYTLKGKVITFTRAGKTYRGRTQSDATCFNFKRIS